MKYLILILISVTLSGCFWQTANNIDLQKAVYFCGGIENVIGIQIQAVGSEYVECTDGNKTFLSEVKIVKEDKQ